MEYIVDITKPPIGPPMVTIKQGLFSNKETEESVKRRLLWNDYIVEYRKAFKAR